DSDGGGELRDTLRQRYLPFTIALTLTPEQQSALAAKLPFIAAMHDVDGRPAAYVCRDFTCQAPVTDRRALEAELASSFQWTSGFAGRISRRPRRSTRSRASLTRGSTKTYARCSRGCCTRWTKPRIPASRSGSRHCAASAGLSPRSRAAYSCRSR